MISNNVVLIGRLTADPDVKYTKNQTAVARFSLAIDRGKDKDGNNKGADYPRCVAFGKTAELIEKYIGKGRMVAVGGRITTGSYEDKDRKKVYTTEVSVEEIKFLDYAKDAKNDAPAADDHKASSGSAKDSQYPGFSKIENDDIPF